MKINKSLFVFALFISLFFLTNTTKLYAGETNVYSDHRSYWDNIHEWDPIKDKGHYRFCTIEGKIYAIRAEAGHGIEIFKFDKENDTFHFHVKAFEFDDYNEYFGPVYDAFAFKYNNKYYVYGYGYKYSKPEILKTKETTSSETDNFYFIQTYSSRIDNSSTEKDWHTKLLKSSDNHQFKIYRSVYFLNNYLYFVYDSYVDHGELLHHNKIYVDKAYVDENNNLIIVNPNKPYKIDVPNYKDSYHPYAVSGFIHPDGKERLLISYDAERTKDKENKGGGVVIYNPSLKEVEKTITKDNCFAIRAIHGTMQAKRDYIPGNADSNSNRIQIFYNHFTDAYWDGLHHIKDTGHFHYRTYIVKEDSYTEIEWGEIHLGAQDRHPDEWNRMNLDVAYLLKSHKSEDSDVGHSFHQQLWMFYTDKDGYIRGCGFNSDIWHQINEDHPVISSDLDNDSSENGYGPNVRGTWVLFGLIEGAPPISVNWEKWTTRYNQQRPKAPTSLKYEQATSVTYTTEITTEASWYIGAHIGGGEIPTEIDTKFSLQEEYESGTENTLSNSITIPIELSEETQTKGKKLYIVPSIRRITYATFPWWYEGEYDANNASSQPLCYKFITTSTQIISESVDLDQPPFNLDVSKVNDKSMPVWLLGNRDNINNNQREAYITGASWDGSTPVNGSFSIKTDDYISTSHSNEFQFDYSIGVPEAFNISTGESISWSTKTSVKTSFDETISVNLNLSPEDGELLNIETYSLKAYWFHKNLKDLWYVSTLEEKGQTPWYIGYAVTAVTPKDAIGEIIGTTTIPGRIIIKNKK